MSGLKKLPLLTDQHFRPKNVPVFNITCCESKKVTWRFVLEEGKRLAYEYPFEAGLWYPDGNCIQILKLLQKSPFYKENRENLNLNLSFPYMCRRHDDIQNCSHI